MQLGAVQVRLAEIGLHQAAALETDAIEVGAAQVRAIEVALLQQKTLGSLLVHQIEAGQLGAGQLQAVAQPPLAHIVFQRLGGVGRLVIGLGIVPAAQVVLSGLFAAVAAIRHQISAHCHVVAPSSLNWYQHR
ncbi:hypothetical protein D3C79_792210 [compost metagenome]